MGKVKASTLIEVLISMVILSISFGLGIMIYFNTLNGSSTYLKLKAESLIQQEYCNIINGSQEDLESDNMKITTTTNPYDGNPNLQLLEISITDLSNKEVSQSTFIIPSLD